MNKSPFSTPRGRGQMNSKPYYRKQRNQWDNKGSNSVSPNNNQEDKNVNTSGSSDDFIPFNNSLPSPFNKSLPSPSLSSPTSVSASSPFYHVQKQAQGQGQFFGQHQRYSLGHDNSSPSYSHCHSPRARGNFNKFNSRRGRGSNHYHNRNNYPGKNLYQKETNLNNYIDQSFFEDPWAELVADFDKNFTTFDTDNLESSISDTFDSSLSQKNDNEDSESQEEIF